MATQKPTILELLTLEELELLENLVGKPYIDIFSREGLGSAKAGYAIHWLIQRRNNAQADINESKKLNLQQLNEAFEAFANSPKAS